MERRHATSRWGLALVAMLFALFVVSPAMNAVACAVEMDPAHVSASADKGEAHRSGGDAMHGAGGHSHCHHGLKEPSELQVSSAMVFAPVSQTPDVDDRSPSFAPEGLIRPPRA
nr:hypothetical protein [uncultured Brevundimonas sp.]